MWLMVCVCDGLGQGYEERYRAQGSLTLVFTNILTQMLTVSRTVFTFEQCAFIDQSIKCFQLH